MMVTHIDPVGNETSYEYEEGQLVRVFSSQGTRQAATYDASGNVLTKTAADGTTTTWTYDEQNRLTSETNAWGTASYEYDDDNDVVTFTDTDGTIRIDRLNAGGQILERTVDGQTTSYEYDADGNQIAQTDPTGLETTFQVDDAGMVTGFTVPGKKTFVLVQDGQGHVTRVEGPDGASMGFTYTPRGDLASITDKDGNLHQLAYKGDLLMSRTDPLGRVTRFERDGAGRQVGIVDTLGNKESWQLDPAGRPIAWTDRYGKSTELNYCADFSNNPCDEIDPFGNLIQRTFDEAGRVIAEESSLGTTYFEYGDACGEGCQRSTRPTAVIDRLGNRTEYAYDSSGNLTSVLDALEQQSLYTYDANDQLISFTEPSGTTTEYVRDGAGRILQVLDTLRKTIEYTYNDQGLIASKQDPAGNTTNYSYDLAGNLLTESFADDTEHLFEYTRGNQIARHMNENADVEYLYDDPYARLTSIVDHTLNQTISITYDNTTGQRASVARPDGTVSYTYNTYGQLASSTLPDGQVIQHRYDAFGRLSEKRFPNGNVQRDSYDGWGRLASRLTYDRQGVLLSGMSYTYDALHHRTSTTDIEGNTTTVAYDALGRLAEESEGTNTRTYTYDEAGNRLSISVNGEVTVTNTYDETHQLLTRTEDGVTTTFTYDDNGNMIGRSDGTETTSYQYDMANRLVQVAPPGVTPTTFGYDALGRRVYRKNASGAVHTFFDGADGILEQDDQDNLLRGIVFGDRIDAPEALLDYGDTGDTYFYHTDALGSVLALSGPSGALVNTYQYTTFGEVEVGQNSIYNDLTYTGRRLDQGTGTYDFRARQLDPSLGRFLQRDPRTPESFEHSRSGLAASLPGMAANPTDLLSGPQGLNPFAYVLNSPLMYTDPSGEGVAFCDVMTPNRSMIIYYIDLLLSAFFPIIMAIIQFVMLCYSVVCAIISTITSNASGGTQLIYLLLFAAQIGISLTLWAMALGVINPPATMLAVTPIAVGYINFVYGLVLGISLSSL